MLKLGTSYFGVRIPRHVRADMEQLARQNFNLVMHTYNENDQLFYHRTMKEIVRVTKEVGHEVYVGSWGVGKVFGGESFSNFVATNLDCLQILSDGKPGGMACPMNPRFREFMVKWIESALDTGAETIFWDEPHFSISTWLGGRPGQWGCLCPICNGMFHDKYGHDIPAEKTPEVHEWLEWAIHDFLSFLILETKKRGGRNALCLLPHDTGEEGAIALWDRFASIPGLDVFGTDPYFELQKKGLEHVEKYSQVVMDCCRKFKLEPQIWFQGFRIAAGRERLQAEAVDIAYKAGVRNLSVWGFEACDHMAWIRPDDPEKLWGIFVDKFGELKSRAR